MFQDLSNSSLTYLNPNQTKASPSVYSENDGSFNSEENLRWATKKIAQKPFIVGKDTAEVNKSFTFSGAPYGAYIGEGLFNIDGHLFKASSRGNVTYDSGLDSSSSFVANTQYVQRFVSELTHYGTSDELSADYSSFCFSEFLPNSGSFDPVNWENALSSGEPIGFVKTVFRNGNEKDESYRSQLYQDGENIEFIYNGVSVSSVPLKLMVQDENDLTPDNVRSIVFHDTDPKDYHAVAQVINRTVGNDTYSDTFIMYPVYVKQTDNNKAIITFTDIFTTTYRHAVSEFMTSSYPSTVSNLIDMTGANFSNPPTLCKTTTMPSNRYNYYEMYSGTARQNTTITRTQSSPYSIQNVEKKELSGLVFPSTVSSLTIKNDLSYYCLINPANPIERNGTPVPVALFTSEGSLCTDGFIVSGNTTLPMDQSPIESYIHYIKRNYLLATGQTVTEDAIEAVTLNQLNYWNNFTTFYNTNIAPALSAYLNLCYDSLLDNVFFNTNTGEGMDFMNIKILGCGEKYVGGVDDDFAKIATVTATGHKYENGSVSAENFETTVRFEKDITSDKYKVTKHVSRSIKTPLVSGKDLFYYEPVVETFTWNNSGTNVYRFEDPQLFITNCIKSGVEGLGKFILYNGHNNDNVEIQGDTGEKIALDEFLVPVRKKDDTSVEFNLGGTLSILRTQPIIAGSLVNSACYKFLQNNWLVVFPTTLSVNKDNLSYLRGRDYDDPDKYDGLTLNYKFPCEVTDDELYMFDMGMTSTRSKQAYDVEQSLKYRFIDSEYIRVRREAFIHVNKLYGDNYKGFRECVEEVTENMIEEASGGYDLSSIPIMRNAIKDHILSSQRNIFYISDNYTSEEFFKTDEDSNVSFKIHRSSVYADEIGVHIDSVGGVRSAVKDTYLDIEFKLFEQHTDLCLIGSPNESSETGLRAELYKKGSGDTLTYLISDFGGWDFDRRDVEHTKNFSPSQTFVYRIMVPAGTEQDSDVWFTPQVFEFSEFNIGVYDVVKYIGTAGSVYNDLQRIKNTNVALTNRPAKNNLSIYSGTGLGKIRIDCIVPFKVTDCILSFESVRARDQSYVQQLNVSFDVYSDDDVCLISDSHIACGDNVNIQINKSDIAQENQNKNIGYIIINNHEIYPLNPEITTTFSGAMLCTKSDWDVSSDFVYGYGEMHEACKRLDTINESIVSLVDRPYKNLLTLNYTSFSPTLENPDLIIDLEYKSDWNYDYILFIGYTDTDLSIKIVDTNDNEFGPYIVDAEESSEAIIEIQRQQYRYIKNIVISTTNNSDAVITNMMLCRKSDWNVSDKFVFSLTTLNDPDFVG